MVPLKPPCIFRADTFRPSSPPAPQKNACTSREEMKCFWTWFHLRISITMRNKLNKSSWLNGYIYLDKMMKVFISAVHCSEDHSSRVALNLESMKSVHGKGEFFERGW